MELGTVIGWLGNAALFAGVYLAGRKHRHAFGFYVLGDALWFWESCAIGRLDWAVPCVIFGLMAGWNWRKWCRDGDVVRSGASETETAIAPAAGLRCPVEEDTQDQTVPQPDLRIRRCWLHGDSDGSRSR